MALDKLNKDMQIIAALSDEPNDVDGLTSAQLKAKFDEAGEAIKAYINNVLLPALEESVGAGNIGATPFEGITGTTVQEQLEQVLASAVKLPETATFKYLNVYPGLFDIENLDSFWNRFIIRLDERGIGLSYYAGKNWSSPSQLVKISGEMLDGNKDGVIGAEIEIGTTEENTDPNKVFRIRAIKTSENNGIPGVMVNGLIRCTKDPVHIWDLANKGYVDAVGREAAKLPPSASFEGITVKDPDNESPTIAESAARISPGVVSVTNEDGSRRYAQMTFGRSADGTGAFGGIDLRVEENGAIAGTFSLYVGRPSQNGGKVYATVTGALRYTTSVEITNDRDLVPKKYVDDGDQAAKDYADSKVADKATTEYVDSKVADKATKQYVDNKVADKATTTYVDSKVADKATTTYVDNAISAQIGSINTILDSINGEVI